MLCLFTPAHGRLELSEICLAQHAHAVEQLNAAGYPTHEVVIACDENLDIARAVGLNVLEHPNDGVGERYNVGFEYARNVTAKWVGPMDSDCWFLPDRYIMMMEWDEEVISTRHLTVVREDGHQLVRIRHDHGHPVLPLVSMKSLRAVGYSPTKEGDDNMLSTSTLASLTETGATYAVIEGEADDLVGFTLPGDNMTTYSYWLDLYGGQVVSDTFDGCIFRGYDELYPAQLVRQIERFYGVS